MTLPEAMPDHHAAFLGKWHLGGFGAKGVQPADQGFEEMTFEFVLDQHASPDGEAWTQGRDVSHELQRLVEEELGPQLTHPNAAQDVGVDTYA